MSDTESTHSSQRIDDLERADDGDSEAYTGTSEKRREDAVLLTGRAEYTDDHEPEGTVHLAFVRSEHGHADLEGIDTSAADAMDGVLGAYTWDDIAASSSPGRLPLSGLERDVPAHPVLATDRVRYHGQPIAVVVAEDRYRARDAVEAVEVKYDPLEAVVDPRTAVIDSDAPQLFEDAPDNLAMSAELGDAEATDEAFANADHIVDVDLENNRLIPSALEPRAAIAEYNAEEGFTVTMTSQSPHGHRRKLAHTLGVREGEIRVIVPHVGGGFGHKGHHHPGEAMAAWCARELERPVKWTATRSENYLEGAHGRDHRTTAELALDDDGTIRGLRTEAYACAGGYALGGGARVPGWYGKLLSSQYAIDAIHCTAHSVFTNTAPIHSYRGAGRPESIYVTERLLDIAASELEMDPAELRRKNLISSESFPYETPVGTTYDSGNYEPAMEKALEGIDYESHRNDSDSPTKSDDGRLRGVGIANYVESTGGGFESGLVRVLPDGDVEVYAGTHSHGQGHETTYAQLVADALEVPMDRIHVSEGDTASIPTGTGTFGSRSTIVGGNAIVESAEKVLRKARAFAAAELEVDPDRVDYADGTFSVASDPDATADESVSFETVAETAYGWGVPDGLEPGLEATTFYELEGTAYTFGTHACIVAVDPDTGDVEIERYLAVDDCGERVNPMIVDGQVHGGVAQGIGQARTEQVVYDDDGTLVTNTMDSYGVPRAADIPTIETDETVTPSPLNELGVKGIGEGGTIAAPPAVVNAVCDALEVDHIDMPLTDERVWQRLSDLERDE
ncbi:xanthine dehydrogenase family protein molybdopterin-binding subunit [Natronolimnobius sp. AArcel1]|uniref:xanthine dehydrogenase family protein molybdopterin-binding subunit n=1 Tax=Natronolimnobius sp. AArcel1 TaxID=1679093 RepID=UPI0013EE3610|nr:xanthine dehydrogenase family protein molybdopterin-binding subunit [Natronolimnobius sp. AArcel1]NGM70849.1 xanthine dehydrogenase family protein molybdopterin-binding subunit [Natronolimnobius sp. AArcel1]